MIGSQNSGMGTEIDGKGYGYYSMRDVNNNEQSSGNNWPLPSNLEYVDHGFSHRNVVEFDKNTLRQTMLEHEAIFKRHVAELHCLYKIQRDMMNEVRRKDVHRHGMMMIPLEAVPSSSSPFSAWNSPLSCTKGGGGDGLKECEILDHRPSKVRKRLFDLQFTPDEEGDCSYDASNRVGKLNLNADASKGFVFLADLNEPTQAEESESFSCQIETRSKSEFLHRLSKETPRRDAEDAIRSNGKRDWPYAERYKNGLNSSSSRDAIQTMGFLQSEQRREIHGRKHNPVGVVNNHKIDWSQNQSWGKSIQNPSTPFQTYSSRPMTSSQLCGQSREMLGDKWQFQAGPSSNLCFSSPLANNHHNNGFYRGSSSGSKDAIACFPPVVGLDHMNAIDKGRKHDHHPHLPSWLKPNSDFKLKNPNSAATSFEQSLGNSTPPPRKILGFTISDYPPTSASLQPITPVCEYVKKDGKSRELIDINVAYYDSEAEENHKVRTHIDLNSCITEEEDPPMEPIKRNLLGPKFSMEIDLEAPPLPDEEEEEEEEVNARIAAEAIVWISVSDHCPDEENSMEDPLGWFAEIVVPNSLFCEEIMDHFEAITLSLPEMNPEEYMPKEAITVASNYEEESGGMVGNKNQSQNRRSRRGRQKRDFQRDILPGLVSLSRHEVSEDIQTFSGMMKATGRTWQSGLTRGRRRRFVVEPDPAPGAEEEEEANAAQSLLEVGGGRSLTVWGKTLRRPRRQRCPAISNLNQNRNKKTINSIISS